jgi:hypothetical protein
MRLHCAAIAPQKVYCRGYSKTDQNSSSKATKSPVPLAVNTLYCNDIGVYTSWGDIQSRNKSCLTES